MSMKRSIEDTSIVMVGAGRLATNLAKAFYRKGFRIMQVYSRTEAGRGGGCDFVRCLAVAGGDVCRVFAGRCVSTFDSVVDRES